MMWAISFGIWGLAFLISLAWLIAAWRDARVEHRNDEMARHQMWLEILNKEDDNG